MRLHSSQIEMVAHSLAKRLAESGMADIDKPEETELHIIRVVSDDLQVEDKLNEEVRAILTKHELDMRDKGIQYHEMFKMVKQKLARERKLIL